MRLIFRDVEVASWCLEMESSLTGGGEEETIKKVALFKYLGQPLEKSNDDCQDVKWNIRKLRQV